MPLETIERETGPSPRHSVIWLHGLGADGNGFVPAYAPRMALLRLASARWMRRRRSCGEGMTHAG